MVGNLLDRSFENCTWMERSSMKCAAVLKQKKILGNIKFFSEQIF